MYKLTVTHRFKKSLKLCKKRGYNLLLLQEVLDILQETGKLPQKFKPHKLTGNYKGCWECHIKPDWLLVWKQNDTELILLLLDTGTHGDLF
ncbi:MAG: type II toxin-antitoxin system YafQ family toxin [Flavobacteriaceae bacterium]